MKRKNKKMLQVLFVAAVCLLNSMLFGVLTVSAEVNVPVIKEFYTGNGKTDEVNGTKIFINGNENAYKETNPLYDATALGGDTGTFYGKIDVGRVYQDAKNNWDDSWVNLASYIYDPNINKNQNIGIVSCLSVKDTAYATFYIRLDPGSTTDSSHYVDLSTYYISLGFDSGWQGALVNSYYYCIPLSRYYSENDIGRFKRISIPLSMFNDFTITGFKNVIASKKVQEATPTINFNYGRLSSLGIMCYYNANAPRNWDRYNKIYIDNVKIVNGIPSINTGFSQGGEPTTVMKEGAITVTSNIAYSEGVWIVARYSAANELLEMAALESVSATTEIQKQITVNCHATDKLKVFLWDGLENIEPLYEGSQLPANI